MHHDTIEAIAEEFWQQGFVALPNFFESQVMQQLHSIILEHFSDSPQYLHDADFIEKSKAEVIPWFPQSDGITQFDKIEQNSQLKSLTEEILGADWKTQQCMVMLSKPQSKGQAWHQDCPPEDQQSFNLNRLVYTMDVNDEVGGHVVIKPKSHLSGEITTGELFEDFEDQVVLAPKAGTLVLIHGHCWHRVKPVNNQSRVSTNFRAIPKGIPEGITDICVYRNMRYQFSTSTMLVER
ncbi:phytanoyl-CoA dioxygenase family protein [Aliiglaciecola lipolytica]|uniref:Phytanoyl-CoA dioxygenase superfamily n=1 Tax=Aliiglaciecola lipolytica E3 TaxID=1127673 RepID=K6YW58_9ALTE|nr:phytanoyl-CoA dioxygenase family protein [Aliiglaciecola lipolytica]GAC15485.1 Phytanoyl-CoA dioxygenase superfamily [Aliiglaciecola lipolytica E3]